MVAKWSDLIEERCKIHNRQRKISIVFVHGHAIIDFRGSIYIYNFVVLHFSHFYRHINLVHLRKVSRKNGIRRICAVTLHAWIAPIRLSRIVPEQQISIRSIIHLLHQQGARPPDHLKTYHSYLNFDCPAHHSLDWSLCGGALYCHGRWLCHV